jgi:hypothetical protein
MKTPSSQTLLQVWEDGAGSHPVRRAVALLDAVWPDVELGRWAHAPIGGRDGWLMRLQEELFDSQLETVTACPRCSETLELSFSTRDIAPATLTIPVSSGPLRLQAHGCEVDYRLTTSEDLLAIVEAADHPADAQAQLLRRCVIEARCNGRVQEPDQLPADVVDRIAEEMAGHDPGADIRIALECPACAHPWSVAFDIVAYVLAELDDWAERTLADVHTLATAYSWSEREILELGPTRRQYYLEMVQA